MRLIDKEVKIIKQTFLDIFRDGKIYLFGSRVNDNIKGGDIDLFLDTSSNILEYKIKFLSILKQKLGDQKIDVILSRDKTRLIEQEALKTGIQL